MIAPLRFLAAALATIGLTQGPEQRPRLAAGAPTSTAQEPGRIPLRGTHLVALSVPNLEPVTSWYRDLFGLSTSRDEQPDSTTRLRILTGHGMTVELIEARAAKPGAGPDAAAKVLIHGIFKVGIGVASLDSAAAVLRARGVAILGHWPRSSPPNLLLQDPAGTLVQLYEVR